MTAVSELSSFVSADVQECRIGQAAGPFGDHVARLRASVSQDLSDLGVADIQALLAAGDGVMLENRQRVETIIHKLKRLTQVMESGRAIIDPLSLVAERSVRLPYAGITGLYPMPSGDVAVSVVPRGKSIATPTVKGVCIVDRQTGDLKKELNSWQFSQEVVGVRPDNSVIMRYKVGEETRLIALNPYTDEYKEEKVGSGTYTMAYDAARDQVVVTQNTGYKTFVDIWKVAEEYWSMGRQSDEFRRFYGILGDGRLVFETLGQHAILYNPQNDTQEASLGPVTSHPLVPLPNGGIIQLSPRPRYWDEASGWRSLHTVAADWGVMLLPSADWATNGTLLFIDSVMRDDTLVGTIQMVDLLSGDPVGALSFDGDTSSWSAPRMAFVPGAGLLVSCGVTLTFFAEKGESS